MPENTNDMSVSAHDDAQFQALQRAQVKVSEPTDAGDNDARFDFVNIARTLMPQYEHTSQNFLLTQLREERPLRDEFVSKYIQHNLENDPEFQRFWNSEDTPDTGPGSREEYQKGLSKNILESISQHAYTGESVKSAIIDHTLELSKVNEEHGIQNPLRLLETYTEDYTQWFDKEDIKNKNVSEEMIHTLYDTDEDFRKQLIRDQVREYESALGNRANKGAYNANTDPSEYAKGFAIFNRFGSEALTDYTNIQQHYVPNSPTQDSRVVSAFRRFSRSPQYKDGNPFQYAEQFVSGRSSLNMDRQDPLYRYQDVIQQEADEAGVDSTLLAGLIMHESVRAANATGQVPETIMSTAGAVGMGQLMAATARDNGLIVNGDLDERTDPLKNIRASAQVLAQNLERFDGDETLALAAYNAGPGATERILARAQEEGHSSIMDVMGEGYYSETANYIPSVRREREMYASNFTEKTGELEFTPRREIDRKPKDWNDFTAAHYYTPENEARETDHEKTIGYIENLLRQQTGGRIENFLVNDELTEIDLAKPIDLERQWEYNRLHQEDFPRYEHFVYDMVAQADDDGVFFDLISTLAANHDTYTENEAGEGIYTLDYRKLNEPGNQYLKILVDGMTLHGAAEGFIHIEGNQVIVEPEKHQRRGRQRALEGVSGRLFGQVSRLTTDEGGNITGVEKHIPTNLRNMTAAATIGFTDLIPEAWGGIVGGWGAKAVGLWQDDPDKLRWFHEQRHKSRDYYSGTLEEYTDPVFEAFGVPFSAVDLGIAGGTLAGYLVATSFIGKGIVAAGMGGASLAAKMGRASGLSTQFNQMAAARRMQNFKEFYTMANRSPSTARRMMNNTFEAVKTGKAYATVPRFAIGSAGVETFTDPQYSLAAMADLLIAEGVLGLDEENRWDIEKTYRTTNSVGRWAMDWIGGEMMGLFLDGMIGVGKFANDYSLRAMRKAPKLGLEFDAKTGRYRPEAESQYFTESVAPEITGARKYLFPETQRWIYNVRNTVDDVPVGNIRESAARYAQVRSPGPHYFPEGMEPTQADIAAKFVGDSNEFMATMRQDLRQIVEDANDKFGGHARLSDEQVTQQVGELYDEFMDNMARNIYAFTGNSTEFNANRFAEMLETHPAVLEDVTPISMDGRAELSRSEAAIAARQHPGSYVIPIGDENFRVYRQDPALWRFDMAQRLRQYSESTGDFDQAVDSHIHRFGLDVNNEGDVDEIGRVIETLEATRDVGFTHQGREGVIEGFDSRGWEVRWDDGSNVVYGEIRGLDGVDATPPNIRTRGDAVDSEGVNRGPRRFDEQGIEVEEAAEAAGPLRTSQPETEQPLPTLDLRGTRQLIDDEMGLARQQMSDAARAERQRQLEEVFPDADGHTQDLLAQAREAVNEGRHDDADAIVREISALRQSQEGGETIELPGVVRLQEIVEQDRAAYEAYRATQDPTDLDMVQEFHMERLRNSLQGGNLDTAPQDIHMLRGMGMEKEAVNEFINENFVGDIAQQQFLRNANESLDFAEGVTDDLLRARVDSKRLGLIRDEAFTSLPERVKTQMVEQADMLASLRRVDTPQKLILDGDAEVTAHRSWETANERFKENRPAEEGMAGREYSIRLAEDLGTGNVRDIAKLQKTLAGGKKKATIENFNEAAVVDSNGVIRPIKNSKGLVVRVEAADGAMPFYAIGRKNNIKGNPTRFVTEQNGKIIYNQEWAFIGPNVTRQINGELRRFNMFDLPSGETVFREHRNGKHVLNVQNPVKVELDEYIGKTLKTNTGANQVVRGRHADQILTPERVFRDHVDAIELIDPRTGRRMYKVVAPESQVLRHGKEVSTPGDQRTPHVQFEIDEQPLTAVEAMKRMSKTDSGKLHSHAWLAVPGLIGTGTVGLDENGDLTPFAKAALALGVLGMGGVMVRSMSGQFKIRKGYDGLTSNHKELFDRFDWGGKIDESGTPRNLTQEEQAMFNRLQKAGVPKDDYRLMANTTLDHGTNTPELQNVEMRQFDTQDYGTWSTYFGEDGGILPRRSSTEADQIVHAMEMDPISQGLVTRVMPGHAFEGGGQVHRPIAWARTQNAPDGKILIDELQVDNVLQRGDYGDTGDINRDLYNAVLDDVVDRALRESNGEFHVTRGHMQAARYGDDPDALAFRKRHQDMAEERVKELRESSSVVVQTQTIERARELYNSKYSPEISPTRMREELSDVRTELGRTIRTFEGGDVRRLGIAGDMTNALEGGRTSFLDIHAMEEGYRLRLKDEILKERAIKEIYDNDTTVQNMFPRAEDYHSFLERGPQSNGLVNFYDNTLPSILRKRYGADIRYAQGDPKNAYDSMEEAFHTVQVRQEGLDRARGKTGKRINWETVGVGAGMAGIAAAAYNMEEIDSREPLEIDGEMSQAGLGAITLLAIAGLVFNRRLRTKMGANIKGKMEAKTRSNIDSVSAKGIEYDGKRFENRELHEMDIAFNPGDPESVTRAQGFMKGLNAAARAGKDMQEWFQSNRYTQAGTQLLHKVSEGIKANTGSRKSNIADAVRTFITDAPQQSARVMRLATDHFNETLKYGERAFDSFPETRGVEVVKDLLGGTVDDQNAKVLFNRAVSNLMDRGVRLSGETGVAGRDIPNNVRQVYDGPGGELIQKLEMDLLNNREVVDWTMSLQHGYNRVADEHLELIGGEINRQFLRLQQQPLDPKSYQIGERVFSHNDLMKLANDWVSDPGAKTYSEFRRTLDPDERHLLRIAKRDSDVFQNIAEIQGIRSRFTDLRGRYHPQIIDHDAAGSIRQRYVDEAQQDPSVMEGMSNQDPEAYARRRMMEDMQGINGDKSDGRALLGFDEDRMNFTGREFSSADDAKTELMGIVNRVIPDEMKDAFDGFIGTRQITPGVLEDAGFIARRTNPDGETVFTVRQPEGFQPDYQGRSFDMFEAANSEKFGQYYNQVMMDPAMRRSRFLENPRNFQMPKAWLVNDPMRAWKTYSNDVGMRLHSLRHGIFKTEDFDVNFMSPLSTAMKNTGFSEKQIANTVRRVDDIYSNQFGIIRDIAGKTPREIEQYMKNKRASSSALQAYRNINYMKDTYGFKYLNWFQTMLTTQAMTSMRAVKQSWGIGKDGLSYEGLRHLENMLMDAHVIKDKDMSFRFDLQPHDMTGQHGDIMSKIRRATQRGADRMSDFSLEKSAARLFGVDVGANGRITRMVADTFHGTNVMNTGMNAHAFMAEASHYARIGREMQKAGIGMDATFQASDGRMYNWTDVHRKLEDLGISNTKELQTTDASGQRVKMKEVDYFIQHEDQLQNFMNRLKNNERVSLNDFDPKYADIIERQWHFATESYHGTNMAMRPEAMNSQLGRTLMMYGSFTYNAAMQTVRRRTLDPVDSWIGRYATREDGTGEIGRIQMPLLMKHIRTGNEEALRRLGVSNPKEAIAQFPVDAITNMWRITAGIGFSVAQYTTLDVMRDIYALPVQMALGTDEEHYFGRTRNLALSGVINPHAPVSQQVSLSELFGGDTDAEDMSKLLGWGLGKISQSSYGGLYLSPYDSINKYGFRGTTSLLPATGIGDRFISDVAGLMSPIANFNFDELPPEMVKFSVNNAPVFASNVFVEQRRAIRERVQEYQDSLEE